MDDHNGGPPETDTSRDILEVFGAEAIAEAEKPPEPEEVDLGELGSRLNAIEATLSEIASQAAYLPPKLRRIGDRVDALSSGLAHDRCRSLLSELCSLDDIVQAGLAAQDEEQSDAALRTLGAVANLLRVLFERQGVSVIETEGAFDATVHQAVRSLPVDDPQFAGSVIEVDRRGFAVDGQVLRFAEVAVGRSDDTGDENSDSPQQNDSNEPPPLTI